MPVQGAPSQQLSNLHYRPQSASRMNQHHAILNCRRMLAIIDSSLSLCLKIVAVQCNVEKIETPTGLLPHSTHNIQFSGGELGLFTFKLSSVFKIDWKMGRFEKSMDLNAIYGSIVRPYSSTERARTQVDRTRHQGCYTISRKPKLDVWETITVQIKIPKVSRV